MHNPTTHSATSLWPLTLTLLLIALPSSGVSDPGGEKRKSYEGKLLKKKDGTYRRSNMANLHKPSMCLAVLDASGEGSHGAKKKAGNKKVGVRRCRSEFSQWWGFLEPPHINSNAWKAGLKKMNFGPDRMPPPLTVVMVERKKGRYVFRTRLVNKLDRKGIEPLVWEAITVGKPVTGLVFRHRAFNKCLTMLPDNDEAYYITLTKCTYKPNQVWIGR